VRISKYLAKHLRHGPHRIGIELDAHGWVAVDDLLRAAAAHAVPPAYLSFREPSGR
jgi:putative RNA 2'-phosphotransferase